MRLLALLLLATAALSASAVQFSVVNPTVAPNQPGSFSVTGTVTMDAGEIYIPVGSSSTIHNAFNAANTAGFDSGVVWSSSFLAWNGTGTYTGDLLDLSVNPGNFGYSGGMPLGLYDRNPSHPSGLATMRFLYFSATSVLTPADMHYSVTVAVPEPISLIGLGVGAAALLRRRRR